MHNSLLIWYCFGLYRLRPSRFMQLLNPSHANHLKSNFSELHIHKLPTDIMLFVCLQVVDTVEDAVEFILERECPES